MSVGSTATFWKSIRGCTTGIFYRQGQHDRVHKQAFFTKYPRYFAELFYAAHFLFHRVFRSCQAAEGLFRADQGEKQDAFPGPRSWTALFLRVQDCRRENDRGQPVFIVQKAKSPSLDKNPSYSPLIKLKRVGLKGQMIEVYKLRTMYPYSEYLQEYIFMHQKLEKGGKIRGDFRVTDWGKVVRKYWLDELPMLYNWIKGDLKLFGVRPLSRHYLSLYDAYVQKLRLKMKPGLIPPYYADMPRRSRKSANLKKTISWRTSNIPSRHK